MEPSLRLRNAVKSGNLAIVKRLVRRFPELRENIDPTNGWSSLHYAGYYGHYLVCVFLVQQGHDRDEISLTHMGETSLHLAALQNHEQTVHYLAQHIPRCLDWVNNEHETALMVAARYGHDPCINLLLDFGADIDIPNRSLNRPIHIAAAYGHLKTLRTLVERNADVNSSNAEGWRPVQYCSTYQVQDYLQSLIHEKQENIKKPAFFNPKAASPFLSTDAITITTAATATATATATASYSINDTSGSNGYSTHSLSANSSQSTLTLQPTSTALPPYSSSSLASQMAFVPGAFSNNAISRTSVSSLSLSTTKISPSNSSLTFGQDSISINHMANSEKQHSPLAALPHPTMTPSPQKGSPTSPIAPIPFVIPPRKHSLPKLSSDTTQPIAHKAELSQISTNDTRSEDSSKLSSQPVAVLHSPSFVSPTRSHGSMSVTSSPETPRTRSGLLDVSVVKVRRE